MPPKKLGIRRKSSSGLKLATPPGNNGDPTAKIHSSLAASGSCEEDFSTLGSMPKTPTTLRPPKESPHSSSKSSPDRGASALIDMTPSPVARDSTPLLPGSGARSRKKTQQRYVPTDWDDSLPYGGKVYLARKKKPDTWLCILLQVILVLFAFGLMYYAWYHTDHMHFHATKLYGHLGHTQAQAMTAEKYLHGKGVAKNHSEAMVWYKKAAMQGHPHSSYNLAVGHLQGLDVGLKPGQAHDLIKHAASNGVLEAADVMAKVCNMGKCDI